MFVCAFHIRSGMSDVSPDGDHMTEVDLIEKMRLTLSIDRV